MLIVPGVCRFSLQGFYIDRPWVNILDMQLDTTGSTVNRAEFAYETAGNILNAWVDHLAYVYHESAVLNSVDWVDLDSASGSTGSRIATSEHTLPDAGTAEGDPASGAVAALVTKATNSGRGQRNGRFYKVGMAEPMIAGQNIHPTSLPTHQDRFDAFFEAINADPGPILDGQRQLVVVHTTGESPTTGTYSVVEALVVQERLATQRRRLRG